jgi:hypothetical protein
MSVLCNERTSYGSGIYVMVPINIIIFSIYISKYVHVLQRAHILWLENLCNSYSYVPMCIEIELCTAAERINMCSCNSYKHRSCVQLKYRLEDM